MCSHDYEIRNGVGNGARTQDLQLLADDMALLPGRLGRLTYSSRLGLAIVASVVWNMSLEMEPSQLEDLQPNPGW